MTDEVKKYNKASLDILLKELGINKFKKEKTGMDNDWMRKTILKKKSHPKKSKKTLKNNVKMPHLNKKNH